MHLKNGSKIEIGNKGDRSYHGTHAKVQATVEQHLREHADKHVRDWAAKTTPPPPPPRAPRQVDPVKATARAKAKQEKQAARDQVRADKVKAREAHKAERAAVKEARAKATAERQAAREAKKATQVASLKAIGAPVTPDGKIDATKVPGATSTFTPPTSADPENSFRGRSYTARSGAEMRAELLGAVGRGGTNEEIIRQAIGHLDVKDATQWEPIAEKYEAGKIETFDQAMAALAKAAGAKSPTRKPDWRDLDFEALRECPGLGGLELPTWLHEAADHREKQEHMAAYYGDHDEHAERAPGADDDEPHGFKPPGDDEDVPF